MRNLYSAILIASSFFVPGMLLGQGSAQSAASALFITNYQFVSQVPVSSTQSDLTYQADIVNSGGALSAVTAVVTSLDPSKVQVVQGQNVLNFTAVPANGQVTSSNTFTVLVNSSVPLDFTQLQWSFPGPAANAGPNQTVAIGSTVTLNGSASTNLGGVGMLTYSWAFASRPAGSAAVLTNSASVMPSFAVDVPGNYVITLTISNGITNSSANVTVSTADTLPVANAGPNQTIAQGASVVLDGSGSTDVDGNPLTYSWALIATPVGSSATLTPPNAVSPSFVADLPGTYVAQLIVADGVASSAPASVTITTNDPPPVANAGPAQVVAPGSLVQLNGCGSTNVDGDILTYQWTLISIPASSSATLSSATAVNPTFTADLPGTYVVQLVVNNGTYNSLPSTVTITTSAVLPPSANAGTNQHILPNTSVLLNGSGTDPQGLPLTYQWALIATPAGSTAALSNAPAANPRFIADVPGAYVAQLIVSDGVLSSAPSTVTISTDSVAPLANAGSNQNVAVGAAVTLDASGSSDANGYPLSYSWAFLTRPNGSASMLFSWNSISPAFIADVPGTYVLQLIVNDGFTNSNPTTVTITAATAAITITPSPAAFAVQTPGILTVLLSAPAPTGGQIISLTSSNPGVASVPATLTIPAGNTGANVSVTVGNAGTAAITASATGFQNATTAVNVTVPVTLTLDATTVGLNRSMNGSISLGAPAPPGGATLTLTSTPNGIVNLQPSTITIAAGSSTGTFSITGLLYGSASIVASSPLYSVASANINVAGLGQIVLPSNMSVSAGQSVAFPVSLPAPAPSSGVTITLGSSDTSKVTIAPAAINIAAGQTTPAVQPQVTGVALGSATISAAAPGYSSPPQPVVSVTASISFSPQTLTITGTSTQNLTLVLSAPAPAAGLTFNLSSDNTSVATVPATVSFPANATSMSVPVTGVSVGSTVIHASALPAFADTTAAVTIASAGSISLISAGTVPMGKSIPLSVILSSPAPAPLTITLTSSNPSVATATPQTVLIGGGSQIPATLSQITGVGLGTATILASAPGYTSISLPITSVLAATFVPSSVTITGPATVNLTLTLSAPAPAPLVLTLSSDNPAVATVPATLTVPANAISVTVPVTSTGAGSTTIHANALPNLPDTTAQVVVLNADGSTGSSSGGSSSGGSSGGSSTSTPGSLSISSQSASVGQNLETAVAVNLPSNAGLNITLTSSDPTQAVVSATAGAAGSGSVTLAVPAGESQVVAYVQGLASSGSVTITASATGLPSATSTITLTPSAFVLVGPGGIGSSTFTSDQGLDTLLDVYAARLDSSFNFAEVQQVRGGLTVSVNVTSVNTKVGTITGSPVTFNGGDQYYAVQFNALTSGSTALTASVPSGFSTPSQNANSITANVTPAGLTAANVTVGNKLEAAVTVQLNGSPQSAVVVTITSNNPSQLLLAKTAGAAGSASISVTVTPNDQLPTFFVQALTSIGTATYTESAPGLGAATGTVTFTQSGVFFFGQTNAPIAQEGSNGVGLVSIETGVEFAAENGEPVLTLSTAALDSSGNILDATQRVIGGQSLTATITSSDPAVGTTSPTMVTIAGGSSSAPTTFEALGSGQTTLSITQPAGLITPAQYGQLTAIDLAGH